MCSGKELGWEKEEKKEKDEIPLNKVYLHKLSNGMTDRREGGGEIQPLIFFSPLVSS